MTFRLTAPAWSTKSGVCCERCPSSPGRGTGRASTRRCAPGTYSSLRLERSEGVEGVAERREMARAIRPTALVKPAQNLGTAGPGVGDRNQPSDLRNARLETQQQAFLQRVYLASCPDPSCSRQRTMPAHITALGIARDALHSTAGQILLQYSAGFHGSVVLFDLVTVHCP